MGKDGAQQEMGNPFEVLIVTSVDAEKDAVKRGLEAVRNANNVHYTVATVGVGAVVAAIGTLECIYHKQSSQFQAPFHLIINAGIAGAFVPPDQTYTIDQIAGKCLIADLIIAADLGAELAVDDERNRSFLSLDELGFGLTSYRPDVTWLSKISECFKGNCQIGTSLTVSTVTGTDTTARRLLNRYPGAVIEAMEGFGVAMAAAKCNIPMIELRTVSNLVGPRNRDQWRLEKALSSLEQAFEKIGEGLCR